VVAAVAAVAPVLLLAAGAATLDFPVVVALPGAALAGARALAAAALLLATPLLARPADTTIPRTTRALLLAVPALVGAVLLAPPGWSGVPAAAAAAMVAAGAGLYAGLAGALVRVVGRREMPLAVAAALSSIASIVLTAIAVH
jgi:hypothetical protein